MTLASNLPTAPADARSARLYRLVIVGAASLMGKEIAEVLRERNFPAADIRLLDEDESMGQLEAVGDEMTFIQSIRAEQFEHVDFAIFASDRRATRAKWQLARDFGNTIIDLTSSLEDEPGASIRSPWLEREQKHSLPPQVQPGPVVVAHPAATVLALLASRAQAFAKIERIIATVLEPASEYGQKGMDELQEQTVNLLSFQDLPKNVFDVQVAFNMVHRFGPASQQSLESVSNRILKHYSHLLPGAVVPSLQVVQAPVFHGCSFSIYVETEQPVAIEDLSHALAGDHVAVNSAGDAPNNVSSAGQENVLVSLSRDPKRENVVWLWVAIDNLRIAALTAVECAETMTASRPRGQIQ